MNAAQREAAIFATKEKARAASLEFFHDEYRKAYATVPVEGHRETWRVKSRDFRLWVMQTLYDLLQFAPPSKLVKECIEEFEMTAICRGERKNVYVRVAEHEGATYIDLCNDNWQAVEVTEDGWRVLDEPPVKFRRATGMTALPIPVESGNIQEVSRFLNIQHESIVLLLSWLTFAFRTGPYPVLAISGVQGAGKSTITRILRALIDPSVAELTTTPKSERDVAIAATNSHLIAMDNLSEISPELSDIMCRVATGGSFRTRELYTNDEEMIFTYRRPLAINGIEELALRPDLLDRSILIHVKPIAQEQRRDEQTFRQEFDNLRPQIFGGLLSVLVAGLRKVKDVKLSQSPRMADFARWGVAVEESLGFKPGEFLSAYNANIEEAHFSALDASPIANTLQAFLTEYGTFDGTALRLLQLLTTYVEAHENGSQKLVKKHPRFPKSANQLSAELARIEPNLNKRGIRVERGRTNRGRFIRLDYVFAVPKPQAA